MFRYDLRTARVVGKVAVADPEQLPIGTFGLDGRLTRPLFEKWISARAVPFSRAERVASRFGFHTSEELMLSTLGLSLSDQYWFRPAGADVDWESVNPYDNVFDTILGQALNPVDDESRSKAMAAIDRDPTVIYSSPDAACGGNLPKYWCIDGHGARRLCKSGKAANGMRIFVRNRWKPTEQELLGIYLTDEGKRLAEFLAENHAWEGGQGKS